MKNAEEYFKKELFLTFRSSNVEQILINSKIKIRLSLFFPLLSKDEYFRNYT